MHITKIIKLDSKNNLFIKCNESECYIIFNRYKKNKKHTFFEEEEKEEEAISLLLLGLGGALLQSYRYWYFYWY